MMRVSLLPLRFSRIKGKAMPPKFEPPPTQPTTTSGYSPASSICSRASWPITVWWSRTWLSTLPREYLASSFLAASSTASEMAMPKEPGESGCSARMSRPAWGRAGGRARAPAPSGSVEARRRGGPARLGGGRRARVDLGAVGLHHDAAVGLLAVGDADHVDGAVEAQGLAGEGQRGAPLSGAGLGGEAPHALLLVVEGLGDGGVRLVGARRAHALVLVVDVSGGVEDLLQAAGAEEGGRAAGGGGA